MPAAWWGEEKGAQTRMKPSYRCDFLVGMLGAFCTRTCLTDVCVMCESEQARKEEKVGLGKFVSYVNCDCVCVREKER